MTPILLKSFLAASAVAGHRFVAPAPGGVSASAADGKVIGVSDAMGAAAGGMLDVVQVGWAELQLGGAVSFGDALAPDAGGMGVVAQAGQRSGAFAMADGEAGDIIPVLVTITNIAAAAANPEG